MWLFFLIYIAVCIYKVKIVGKENKTEYMSIEKTQSIKGIFILLVFFSHFNSYVVFENPYDMAYKNIFSMFGQTMVTLFMFYSGYGVMEAIKRKGMSYVNHMPVRRIASTLFKFDLAVIIYAVIALLSGGWISGKQFLLSLVAWESVGNSNWYIFAILVLYLFTYIAFRLCSDKMGVYIPAFLVLIFTCAYIIIFVRFQLKAIWWYDTVLCYVAGMWYSLLRDKIECIVNRNNVLYVVTLGILVAATAFCKMHSGNKKIYLLLMLFFTATVIVITMKVSFDNKILRWCGRHLFEIYIMQRVPMIIFAQIGILDFNMYLYFVICLIATVGITVLFEKFSSAAWNCIIQKRT